MKIILPTFNRVNRLRIKYIVYLSNFLMILFIIFATEDCHTVDVKSARGLLVSLENTNKRYFLFSFLMSDQEE